MSIIGNVTSSHETFDVADRFLFHFERSRREMAAAKEAMLECSKIALDEESRARYDATHKKMARLLREWNRLEEFRESAVTDRLQSNVIEPVGCVDETAPTPATGNK